MDQQDTKTLILDAAESLFGEHGFDGTSLRKLTGVAGVNLAAVNYHFRSKEGLLDALFDRRLEPMNLQRLDLLDEVQQQSGDQPWPLEKVLHALLWPPLNLWHDHETGGARFMRLLGRIHSEPSPQVRGLIHKVLDDGGSLKYALCTGTCSGSQHHHEHVHFKCTECGQTNCLDIDIPAIRLPKGYEPREVNLLIQGVCQQCSR